MTAHSRELLAQASGAEEDALLETSTHAAMRSPSVSVVICGYTLDRLPDMLEAIESIRHQDLPASELIVVVDHNPALRDALRQQVERGIVLVENTWERGLSGARNTGIAHALGDLVVFLDDDAAADPACLRVLAERCSASEVIGAGALIEPAWPGSPPPWFPGEFLWVVGCSYDGLEAGETRNLLGAAMCIRRDVFTIVGGFDSSLGRRHVDLPLGCEETELCIRASWAFADGHFVFEPRARVAHKVSANRLSWSYFAKRCYAEGLSKAHLSYLVGTDRSLASERTYLLQTLPRGIVKNLQAFMLRGEVSGVARAAAIVLGVACTGAGFLVGRGKQLVRSAVARATVRRNGAHADLTAMTQDDGASGLLSGGFALRRSAQALLAGHGALLSNAGLLALGTGIASFLGFFYWWLAARTLPAAVVGTAAAAISLMNFVGHLGEVGLGALLIGELHRFRERPGALISAALAVSTACSALLGLCYMAISAMLPGSLDLEAGGGGAAFVLGCALTGLTLVLDQAMVGLLRSWLQVWRNVSFAIIKLALIAAVPLWLAIGGPIEGTILATWVAGQVASVALLVLAERRRLDAILDRPDPGILRPLLPGVVGHHGLNLANLAPGLLLPFIVAVLLSPAVNAAFYVAWTLTNTAFLVPASLATVVYSVGAKNPSGLRATLRMSLGISALVGLGVAVVFNAVPGFILGFFSPDYARVGASSLGVLGLSILPITIKYHYASIQRLRRRMLGASALVGVGSVLELGGAIVGGSNGSLDGLTLGWLSGACVEALLMAPAVVACLVPDGPVLRLWPTATAALASEPPIGEAAEDRG